MNNLAEGTFKKKKRKLEIPREHFMQIWAQ